MPGIKVKTQDDLEGYDYALPRDRIAQAPAEPRDGSRLMVVTRAGGPVEHRRFSDLPSLLGPGDVVVVNDSRVVPARVRARRATGGRVELLLVDRAEPGLWRALIDSPRRLREGEVLSAGGAELEIRGRGEDGLWRVRAPETILESGEPPLPPYIRRPEGTTEEDRRRYQTVYATVDGSIAAPTAGLHFTEALIARLGVPLVRITMHIGVGTFLPVKAVRLSEHRMAPERYAIEPEAMRTIEGARRVVAVGTSVVRALESQARTGKLQDASDLFIYPPFEFRRVGALVTNLHLPRGTPLALTCAFGGRERVLGAYEEALREGYRFYSFGDAMFVI